MTASPNVKRMVGRDAELAVLLDAFAAGAHGEPRAVIVRGESGIGKTRLIREFLTVATGGDSERLPVILATGQCIDLGSIGAPFTPIRRMLHELHAGVGDEAFRAAAGGTATLATIGTLVPEIAADAVAGTGGSAAYVAEAIELILDELSRASHLIIVLEDLHWADTATLALLKTLASTLRGTHLTLVATYRSDDVGRGHPLRPVVAELERSRTVSFVDVARLDRDGVAELTQLLGSAPPTMDQVDKVLARSEGVPFFVEELIRLVDQPLPPTLRDVVLARYEQLSDNAKRAVGVAAVCGVHVDDETLQTVWTSDPDELTSALREAVADGILIADENGYTFRHALIQEAVYDDLLPRERAAGHRAIGAILQERVDGGDTQAAGAAAEHWLAVHDVARTFDATVVARARARADLAPETAARLGERLLELWPQVEGAAVRTAATATALAVQIANDYVAAGRNKSALRVAESALKSAPDDAVLDSARLHLAAMEAFACDTGMASPTHVSALEALLDRRDDPEARRMLARSRAERAWSAGTQEDRVALVGEAFDFLKGVDDSETLALLLRRRARALQQGRDYEGALADLRRAHDLSPDGSRARLVCLINLTDHLMIMRRFSEAIEVGFEGVEWAALSGLERSGSTLLYTNLAESLIAVGRIDEGLDHVRRGAKLVRGESAQSLGHSALIEATVHIWADDLAAYENTRRAIAPTLAALPDSIEATAYFQALALDAAAARSHDAPPQERVAPLAVALAEATSLFSNELAAHSDVSRGMLISVGRAHASLAQFGEAPHERDVARVRELMDVLAQDTTTAPYAIVVDAFVRDASGAARSLDAWRAAVDLLEVEPMPVRIVHEARYRLALALADAGEKADAVALLRRVVDEAPPHGIALVARWAREALKRLGANRTPSSGPLEGLTPRELEVLALVAEGLTNRDIGAHLFMSPKTASVHVSAILAKLGASNRTEAATLYTTQLARDPD